VGGFTWHCLRHTFASRLVMAGVDLRTVKRLLGHKRIATTERCAHLSPEHELAAVEKLAAASAEYKGTPERTPGEMPPQGGFGQPLATSIR